MILKNKKILFGFKCGLLLLTFSAAQEGKSGFTISSFGGSNFEPVYGLIIGTGYKWELSEKLSIAGEILYLQRGGIVNRTYFEHSCCWYKNTYQYSLHCKIGYLDIPVLIYYNLLLSNRMKFQIYGGMSACLSIIDKSKEKDKNLISSIEADESEVLTCIDCFCDEEYNVFSNLQNSGYSFNLGFNIIWRNYLFDLRYSRDLHGIERAYCTGLNDKKSHAICIMLGVFIPGKVKKDMNLK